TGLPSTRSATSNGVHRHREGENRHGTRRTAPGEAVRLSSGDDVSVAARPCPRFQGRVRITRYKRRARESGYGSAEGGERPHQEEDVQGADQGCHEDRGRNSRPPVDE